MVNSDNTGESYNASRPERRATRRDVYRETKTLTCLDVNQTRTLPIHIHGQPPLARVFSAWYPSILTTSVVRPSTSQSYLQGSLPPEQLVTAQWRRGVEEHVDHDVVEVRDRARDPLDDDKHREVAKQGTKEQALGNELIPEKGKGGERGVEAEQGCCEEAIEGSRHGNRGGERGKGTSKKAGMMD